MSGTLDYAYGMWFVVLLNIGLVLAFVLSFLTPKRRVEWRSLGLFTAWIAALFSEMYGFPLTIYLLTALLGRSYPVLDPFSHKNGHLLVVLFGGSTIVWIAIMLATTVLFWIGFSVMEKGWRQIHQAKGALVTDGIYTRIRHPQYAGLFMLIGALLIQWPTLLSILMAPVLVVAYVRLARREEREMEAQYGLAYAEYRRQTPAFFPKMRTKNRWIKELSQDALATSGEGITHSES